MFKLVISDDEGKNTVVPLVRDEVTIGRKDGNTIRLTERNVSRRHARLRRVDGAITLEDLGSYNGVRVNGRRIKGEHKLEPGDQIVIGDYLIALQAEGAEHVATPDDIKTSPSSLRPAPSSGPPARLVLLSPAPGGAEFAITKDKVRVGRAETADIVIQHRSISREHAEITRERNGLSVLDLASANGMRVNGRDVQRALLKPADILELGQVRLTFVGEGEDFIYDPSMSETGAEGAEGGPSKLSVLVGGAVIACAAIGAVFLFTTLSAPVEVTPPQASVIAVSADPGSPSDPGVVAQPSPDADAVIFNRAVAELQSPEPNLERVYYDFESLPAQSPYRSRPEVADATLRYARVLLAQAEDLAPRNRAEARRLAGVVLAMTGLPEELVARARRYEAPPDARLAAADAQPVARPTPPVATDRAPAAAPTAPAVGAAAAANNNASCLERARACLSLRDNACVLAELEGCPQTETSLNLLISTLTAMDRRAEALRKMRQFVRAYPNARQTARYQQLLDSSATLAPNPY